MGIISDLITRAWTIWGSYKSHLSRLPIPTGGYDCYPLRKFPWRLTRHLKLLQSSREKKEKKIGLRKRNNVLIQVWHTWRKMLTILESSKWEVGEGGRHSLTNDFHSYSAVSDQTGIRQETFLLDLSLAFSPACQEKSSQWSVESGKIISILASFFITLRC